MVTKEILQAFTFDDLLLIPAKTEVLPKDVDTSTRITRNISIRIPLISAAMDTVTESAAAIVMAQEGGLGIIHKNLSIEDQVLQAKKVKRFESGIIVEPVTIEPDKTIQDAIELRKLHNVSGFPVVSGKKVVGMLTNRDIQSEKNHSKPVKDVMTPQDRLITIKEGEPVERAREMLVKNRIEKLPIVNDAYELRGLITSKDLDKEMTCPNATRDSDGRLRVGAAIGVGPQELERASALIAANVDCIVIDTAHGHSKGVLDTIKLFKDKFRDIDLVAGNIATGEAAEDLIKAGADALKIGMGPGSICTTRIVAGVGMPQISAVMSCAEVARKKNVPVIADGGIKFSGEITKAIAAGADVVMIGSLFAGTDESPGDLYLYHGRPYKGYRGMGSLAAMEKGSKERYSQGHIKDADKLVPEGIEGRVPYQGKMAGVIHQLVGGLRSGMGYTGCTSIEELKTKTKFVRITPSGLRESHVHDVIITKEAQNYRVE